jgi:hypothetical protein
MAESDVPAETLALLALIAGAIRDELGEEIDAYPGGGAPERADPINRAFRAVVAALLRGDATATEGPPAPVSRALRQATERRLAAEGWDDRRVRLLIEEEPGSPDDWLAFLLLSSRAQIAPLFTPDDPGFA